MKTISQTCIFVGIMIALFAGVFMATTLDANAQTTCGNCENPSTPSTGSGNEDEDDRQDPPSCSISASATEVTADGSYKISWVGTDNATYRLNNALVSATGNYDYTMDAGSEYERFVIYGKNSDGECADEVKVYQKFVTPTCDVLVDITKVDNIGDYFTVSWNGTPANANFTINGGGVDAVGSAKLDFIGPNYERFTFRGEIDGESCEDKVEVTKKTVVVTPTCEDPNATNTGAEGDCEYPEVPTCEDSAATNTGAQGDCEYPTTPAPICDAFTASPSTITKGSKSTLSWETTNATQVAINNGVGTVAVDGNTQVSPLANTTYKLTALNVDNEKVTCTAHITVNDEPVVPVAPNCPLVAKEGRTIIDFGGDRLFSNRGLAAAQGSIESVNLSAGEYDITLVSWDGYANRVNVSQAKEQYQLDFLSGNTVISSSNAIRDLADNVIEDTQVQKVNTGFVLASNVTAVRATHAFYGDNSSANSVQAICAAVDYKPQVVETVPECTSFTVTPSTLPVGGGTVVLDWDLLRAATVSINNGIGDVTIGDGTQNGSISGSRTAHVTQSTTFVLTATDVDGDQVSCQAPVAVADPGVFTCSDNVTFTASDTSITEGDSSTLNWDVNGADSVSISTIGSVSAAGNQSVAPTSDTTYTLTATKAGYSTISCPLVIEVEEPQTEVFTCSDNVSFSASDTSIDEGDDTELTWNVTGSDSVSISGLGTVSASDNETVSPSDDITYTLTATKAGFSSISCPLDINVSTGGGGGGGGGGSATPRCELEISAETIESGDEVTLTWETRSATEITLTDDRGNVLLTTDDYLSSAKDEFYDYAIEVTPTRNTTYTLVAERGSRDRECEVEVEVEGDELVVLETRTQAPLVTGISLSQVPYTGFEAGPVMTILFYMLLVAWALYITYVLVIPKTRLATATVDVIPQTPEDMMAKAEAVRPDVFAPLPTTSVAPANLPTVSVETVAEVASTTVVDEVTTIENIAHKQQVLISSDAVRTIIDMTTDADRVEKVNKIIVDAKGSFPMEDGWVVVNQARLSEITSAGTTATATQPVGAGSLAESIVTGNIVAAYELIGARPMIALADAAADLDAVYRNRKGEVNKVSDLLTTETAELTNDQISEMIASLTGALDGTYTDEASAVKMAIMKAVKVVA